MDEINPIINIIKAANKDECPVIYQIFFQKLLQICDHKGIIKFPDVNHFFSLNVHLRKEQTRLILSEMEEIGLVRIVPFHYIILDLNQEKKARCIKW